MPSGMIGVRQLGSLALPFASNSPSPLRTQQRDKAPQNHRALAEERWSRPLTTHFASRLRNRSLDPWRPRATSEDSDDANDDEKTPKKSAPPLIDSAVFIMRLPFLYASTLASTNDHYLQQRKRTRWWSRGAFPRVGPHTLREAMLDENVNHPFKLLIKMVPLGMIFFCATFNLCILQNMKDTLVVSTIGAESLPFLASFGVLPASFLFFGFYHTMLNKLPHRRVFYVTVLPLLALYTLFVTAMYPSSNWLHLHGFFDVTSPFVPLGFHGLLRCIENWTYSLFFCVAELWGAVVISVLFWSLANDVCSVKEAKTIYPSMGISANVALVFAGKLVKWVNQHVANGSTLISYRCLVGIVVASSVVMMSAKLFIDKTFPTECPLEDKSKSKSKKKKSFKDGLTVLRESPKILNLALLVIGYSVSHRFFEVVWKGQLKLVYPTAQDYQSILADVSVWTGVTTIAMMLTGKFIFQYLGWGVAASASPLIMLVTGSVFYLSFLAFSNGASLEIAKIGAVAGNITQVATRASKFSLFDPAKEMVYIEMDKHEKRRGKAAVDLVGSQVGKTGAAWVSQALLLGFGSIASAMPVFGCLYGTVILVWLLSVNRLHKQLKQTEFERKQAGKEPILPQKPKKQKRRKSVFANSAEAAGVSGTEIETDGVVSGNSVKEVVHEREETPAVLERLTSDDERLRQAASLNGTSSHISSDPSSDPSEATEDDRQQRTASHNGSAESEERTINAAMLNGKDVSPSHPSLNGSSDLGEMPNRVSGFEETKSK